MERDRYNKLSKEILDACLAVHKAMGPGLIESIYELCLVQELRLRRLPVGIITYRCVFPSLPAGFFER